MRALITSATPPHAELASVPDPAPRDNEALVEVHAISLNRGEVRQLAAKPPGTVTGWDLAGVVRTRAADGGGPAEGARVVGMVPSGAWAQLAAVRTTHLAVLPDEVSFEQAAALPVAGLTALRALEAGGFVLGKRVLVTGASGGVGRFGIQLARLAGAHVTAVARRTDGLRGLGADAVLSDLEQEGPHLRRRPRCRGGGDAGDGALPGGPGRHGHQLRRHRPRPRRLSRPRLLRARPRRSPLRAVPLR